MTTRQYLTVEQLAKIWQISKRTIYRMIDSGELSARKFGLDSYRPRGGNALGPNVIS